MSITYLCLTNTLERWLQEAYKLLSLQFSSNLDYLSSFIFFVFVSVLWISRSPPQPNTPNVGHHGPTYFLALCNTSEKRYIITDEHSACPVSPHHKEKDAAQ